jgi:plasmid stabilization system protein ParE
MNRLVEKTPRFKTDAANQLEWYLSKANVEVAWRFAGSVEKTIHKLSMQPEIGRLRTFRHPTLRGLRSFRLNPPFQNFLIFYRLNENVLTAARLMHGARNLARRLAE